jgi:hypothetical protein
MKKLLFYLAIFFLFISCEKNIETNIKISASGFVFDSIRNKNLSDISVFILGYKHIFMNNPEVDTITSAKTNIDGFFTMNFVTNGKSDSYYLAISSQKVNKLSYYIPEKEKHLKIGENTNIKVIAIGLIKMNVHLKINNNPYNSIIIYDNNYFDVIGFENLSHIDTTIVFSAIPMNKFNLKFYSYIYSKQNNRTEYWELSLDTIDVKLSDTSYLINIDTLKLKKYSN